jgi:hypothetical protein
MLRNSYGEEFAFWIAESYRMYSRKAGCISVNLFGLSAKPWVFQTFEGIDILSVSVDGLHNLRQVLSLRPVHQQIVRLFGSHVRNCYLLVS